jgi:hypothetical protein
MLQEAVYLAIACFCLTLPAALSAAEASRRAQPLRAVVDLSVGESAQVQLSNGDSVRVRLLEVAETRDSLRDAVIAARAEVQVDGQEVWLPSANYQLPTTVGKVQVDCPITKAYYRNTGADTWGLLKDARLRLWPAGSPWMEPGSFTYPARQRWSASMTQMANEPCYVDVSPDLSRGGIYYHNGLDIGGAEGLIEVVAATDGMIVAKGKQMQEGVPASLYDPRDDRLALLDERGWLHFYCHLKAFAPGVEMGKRVRRGDLLGILGKEGDSGGWSHLHYAIFARQPSGKWGTEEGYAYLWEAYLREHHPPVLAVARPHRLVAPGEGVMLDGSRSWARDGKVSYHWRFSDGTTAEAAQATRRYDRPGIYSEILQVSDASGNLDYDFAIVQVFDAARGKMPAGIHATYAPTLAIRPGDPVTFLVRAFNSMDGAAAWDFGDGTPPVTVTSNPVKPEGSDALAPDGYATTVHRFAKPGHYLVRVEHTEGQTIATARLHVVVEDGNR